MNRAGGFTLIEVLVALTILSVALAAASRAAGAAVAVGENLRLRLLAGWVAENRFAEYRAIADWPPFGRREGMAEMAGERFAWQETVASTPHAAFRRIDIAVTAADGTQIRFVGYLTEPGNR